MKNGKNSSSRPKKSCETLRFYISQRKTSGLESTEKRPKKVQDLAKDAEEPDNVTITRRKDQ